MASSQPATSAKVVFGMSLLISLALDLANCITRPPPPCTWFIRNRNSRMISANGSRVPRIEPSRLGLGFSTLYFLILPASTCFCTSSTSWTCWSVTQVAITLSPLSSVACICWLPPSLKVISLMAPDLILATIDEVSISLYPALGTRYCRATRTPMTATTIQSQGLRTIRFTRAILSGRPSRYE